MHDIIVMNCDTSSLNEQYIGWDIHDAGSMEHNLLIK